MPTQAAPPTGSQTKQVDLRPLLSRITRDQGPEFEQTLNFAASTQVSTPTSIRTDRKIKYLDLHFRGRITNGLTAPTFRAGPPILNILTAVNPPPDGFGNVLFSLIQQFTLRGQHLKYGSQTMVQMRGETMAEFITILLPNYIPQWTADPTATGNVNTKFGLLNAAASTATTPESTDVQFSLPVPLFPPDVSGADSVMYAIHGPDWPGNLYVDLLFADGTALQNSATPSTLTFSAFGSASGTPTVDILSERPLLGKDYMSSIRGALTYRITYFQQPTAAVASGGGTGVKLSDLTVGKDTSRIFLKTGTQAAGNTAQTVTYGTLSDSIVTRTVISLDARNLRFQNANGDLTLQDYMGRSYGHTVQQGYKMIDFVNTPGSGPSNPKSSFGSSQLTAARKFELDGDVTAATGQIAEVIQEMILGAPGITTS
jgi:hypothetical protein